MRNGGIGLIIGIVLGIIIGATVIAPRLAPKRSAHGPVSPPQEIAKDLPKLLLPRPAVEMKMASAVPSSVPIAGALGRRFDRKISEISRGDIEVGFNEPGVLVGANDVFEAVGSGAVDAAFIVPGLVATPLPVLELYGGFPFGPGAAQLISWLYASDGLQILQDIVELRGVHLLVCGILPAAAAGWFHQPVEVLSDLRGLRVGINGLGAKVLTRLGAIPHGFDVATVKQAIDANELDGVVYAAPSIDASAGFQAILPYYYLPGWQRSPGIVAVLINMRRWNQLRGAQRIQMETVCGDNLRDAIAEGEAAQYQAIKELQAGGTQLHRWPTPIRDELQRTWSQVVEEEGTADAEFRRVWTSLSRFRDEQGQWQGGEAR